MEKEQSILAKQPSAHKTRGSLCFTEQEAFKAGCETFWQAKWRNALWRRC